jgi:hypothetical protein
MGFPRGQGMDDDSDKLMMKMMMMRKTMAMTMTLEVGHIVGRTSMYGEAGRWHKRKVMGHSSMV